MQYYISAVLQLKARKNIGWHLCWSNSNQIWAVKKWHLFFHYTNIQSVSNWCIHSFKRYFPATKLRQIQFLLCIIQKALGKPSNTFIVLHVFKQTWRWNYHSMNVNGYWKIYCKVENVVEVQRRWRVEFGTPPPTRVTKKSLTQCSREIGMDKSSVHRILNIH